MAIDFSWAPPPEVISHAIWLYHRFTLSFRRDAGPLLPRASLEEMLAIRGIQTSYESIRRWCLKFPREYTKSLRKRQGRLGDNWYMDEVIISVGGKRQYLWRAVDQDGDVIDILVQSRRNRGAALREIAPSQIHITDQYENNRAEVSHQARGSSRPGSKRDKCDDLNRRGKLNAFYHFMDW